MIDLAEPLPVSGARLSDMIRWTVTVSKDTDSDVRSYLAEHGGEKGDLSKFVERAVQRAVLWATVRDIQARNADLPAEELQALIDEACAAVRKEFWKDRVWWTDPDSPDDGQVRKAGPID